MNDIEGLVWDVHFDFPALVLMGMSLLLLLICWRLQRRKDFDFAQMFKDESGKTSSSRFFSFVCLNISSWAIMYILVSNKGKIETWILLGYIGIWSGAKVVEKAIDAWALTKGAMPLQPVTPAPTPTDGN